MREPGLPGPSLLRSADGLGYAEVRRMRRAKQGIEYENIDSAKRAQRVFRQLLRVRDVTELADAVAVNGDRTVRYGYRHDLHVSDTKTLSGRDCTCAAFGFARPRKWADRIVEDVCEALCKPRHGVGRSIHVDRNIVLIGKRANVVYTLNMIRVIVREENC